MPQIGEIRTGKELGYKGYQKYIWVACVDCGLEKWRQLIKGKPQNERCFNCIRKRQGEAHRGVNSQNWKGGRLIDKNGYVSVHLYPDDFFYPMASKWGTVLEHRLIMAQHLNRCLLPWEVVHHLNGIRGDNRIENLELLPTAKYHLIDNLAKSHIKRLQIQLEEQAMQIRLLKWQIKQVRAELPSRRIF